MKKMFAVLPALGMLLVLAACGGPAVADDPAGQSGDAAQAAVVAIDFASDELLAQPDGYESFVAEESEYQIEAAVTTDAAVSDFKVVSLSYEGEEGSESLAVAEELYSLAELTPDKPLVITMTFVGEIPNMGITYVDADGTEKSFAIVMSGEDGSLLLTELA